VRRTFRESHLALSKRFDGLNVDRINFGSRKVWFTSQDPVSLSVSV
jgi:hypothetical protein